MAGRFEGTVALVAGVRSRIGRATSGRLAPEDGDIDEAGPAETSGIDGSGVRRHVDVGDPAPRGRARQQPAPVAPRRAGLCTSTARRVRADRDPGQHRRTYRRTARPEEIAALCACLASAETRSTTGAVQIVDSGRTVS